MKKKAILAVVAMACVMTFGLTACADNTPPPAPAPTPAPAATPAPETPAPDTTAQDTDRPAEPTWDRDFPNRAITIYNSSAAGSPADVMARELGRSIEYLTNQPVNIVNRPGGGGGVMFGSVLGSPADGYNWGSFTAAQIASLPGNLENQFPIENFVWVANIQKDAHGFGVHAESPFQTLEDLVEYARENPGRLRIGGQGTGSAHHLVALQLQRYADIDFVWVPFDGGAESLTNLLGRHVDAIVSSPTTQSESVDAGLVRMLAVTGTRNLPHRPDVPTFEQRGFEILETQYRGIFVPRGVDEATIQDINDLVRAATLTYTFQDYLARINMVDEFMHHEDFFQFVLDDIEHVRALARDLLGH